MYEISVETVPEQLIVASRRRTGYGRVSSEIRPLLDSCWAYIRKNPSIRGGDGHNVAIYWDPPPNGSVEVGVQASGRFEDTADVVCSATPGGKVARVAHYGPYTELGRAYDAMGKWLRENGHLGATPFWEIYGDWYDDWSKVRTDILYLVK